MTELTAPGKRCPRCGQWKLLTEFSRNRTKSDGLQSRCKACCNGYHAENCERAAEVMRRWREDHPEEKRAYARQVHSRNRTAVFDHYGWSCRCCGSTERLTIDHVNGDGRRRMDEERPSSTWMYYLIIKNGFPEDLQTLCDPCNQSKRRGNRCRLDHQAA